MSASRTMIARRSLVAFAAALPIAPAEWRLAAVPGECVVLTERTGATRVRLPARHCRLVAGFRLAGTRCAAVSFAARTGAGEDIDLLAVAGGGRVLALEAWAGTAADGAHLSTRLDLLPLQRGLVLRRDAALPRDRRLVWERQSWTEILAAGPATSTTALVDAPARPPLPGTWQFHAARRRAEVLARLQRATESVEGELSAIAAAWPWEADAY